MERKIEEKTRLEINKNRKKKRRKKDRKKELITEKIKKESAIVSCMCDYFLAGIYLHMRRNTLISHKRTSVKFSTLKKESKRSTTKLARDGEEQSSLYMGSFFERKKIKTKQKPKKANQTTR